MNYTNKTLIILSVISAFGAPTIAFASAAQIAAKQACPILTTNEATALFQTGVYSNWTLAAITPAPVGQFSVVNVGQVTPIPDAAGLCHYWTRVAHGVAPQTVVPLIIQ